MNLRTAAFIAALGAVTSSFAVVLPAQAQDRGKQIFDTTCVACHGKDGKGVLPGTPNLRKVMAKSDEDLVRNTLNGYQSPGSPLAMPPKGGNPSLTEADVRAVIQYMRSAFSR